MPRGDFPLLFLPTISSLPMQARLSVSFLLCRKARRALQWNILEASDKSNHRELPIRPTNRGVVIIHDRRRSRVPSKRFRLGRDLKLDNPGGTHSVSRAHSCPYKDSKMMKVLPTRSTRVPVVGTAARHVSHPSLAWSRTTSRAYDLVRTLGCLDSVL